MSGFINDGLYVFTRNGRDVTLMETLEFERSWENGGHIIIMPIGSKSDGASIPEVLWSTGLAPFGPWWLACVLHDGLYRRVTQPAFDDRATCDAILLEAMQALGVEEAVANIIYDGVRLGGETAWQKDRGIK